MRIKWSILGLRYLGSLPTISAFYGNLVRMFHQAHLPPHLYARYGEFEATVDIETLQIVEGELPTRAFSLVREWR